MFARLQRGLVGSGGDRHLSCHRRAVAVRKQGSQLRLITAYVHVNYTSYVHCVRCSKLPSSVRVTHDADEYVRTYACSEPRRCAYNLSGPIAVQAQTPMPERRGETMAPPPAGAPRRRPRSLACRIFLDSSRVGGGRLFLDGSCCGDSTGSSDFLLSIQSALI